jgi:hypothetical protein
MNWLPFFRLSSDSWSHAPNFSQPHGKMKMILFNLFHFFKKSPAFFSTSPKKHEQERNEIYAHENTSRAGINGAQSASELRVYV